MEIKTKIIAYKFSTFTNQKGETIPYGNVTLRLDDGSLVAVKVDAKLLTESLVSPFLDKDCSATLKIVAGQYQKAELRLVALAK